MTNDRLQMTNMPRIPARLVVRRVLPADPFSRRMHQWIDLSFGIWSSVIALKGR
jgi:hypothetical protein